MNAESTLLRLLSTRSAALRAGDKEAAFEAIQDLSDATLFGDATAVQSRATREYEQSFGETLEALHPFVEAYGLLLDIGAERAAGRPIDRQADRLRALMGRDECEELPVTSTLSAILQGVRGRLAA